MRSDLVDIAGEIKFETEKAYRFYDGKVVVWIAKIHCEWDPDDKTMAMPEWVAKDKGLI